MQIADRHEQRAARIVETAQAMVDEISDEKGIPKSDVHVGAWLMHEIAVALQEAEQCAENAHRSSQ